MKNISIDYFETERLILKITSSDDAPFIFELMNTPKWISNIGDRNIDSIEIAKDYIKTKMTPQFEELGYSNYTINRKSDGYKVGTCGIYNRDGLEGVDIGFALLPQYENKGYGFESASKLMELAQTVFAIKLVKGITSKTNVPSQNLLIKLGLTFKENLILPDETEEIMLFEKKFNLEVK